MLFGKVFKGRPITSGGIKRNVVRTMPMPVQPRVSTPGGVTRASSNNGIGRMLRSRVAKKTSMRFF